MKNAIGIVLSFIFFVSACSANGNQNSKNQTNMIKSKSLVVFFSHAGETYSVGNIEVGNTKIGTPCNAANDEDRNYIESPYSLNSIEDFQDNIRSSRNSYAGVNGGSALSNYVQSINPDLDTKVKKAIEDALKAIAAIPEPFATNATGTESKNAVKVVGTDLADVLSEVMELITK